MIESECIPHPDKEPMEEFKQAQQVNVNAKDTILWPGTPVICHGFSHPHDHLNGKVGDILSQNVDWDLHHAFKTKQTNVDMKLEVECYTVRFEDKRLGTMTTH